jgi:Cu/Ag efflux pump CusA
MGWLIRGALHFRLLVLGVAAGVLTVGVVQLRSAPVDVLPEFTPTYAEVQTEALGLSADEVEQLITVPLEADLLNGVEGIETIRSESLPGLSSIVMVFAGGTDIYQARQLVEERLTQAHALPNVSKPPTLLQPLSSSNRVLMIGLDSDKVTPIEQSVIARWTVRPRLLGVPGVANVSMWGQRDQQLQVQVDPQRLADEGVTLSQVIESAGNAQVVSPLTFLEASTPGTGGFIETPQQRLQVRHIIEKIADPAELGKVPVEGTNGRLLLRDVANITFDHQPLIGDAVVAGGPGLFLVVEKFPGANTLEVTEGVEDAVEALKPGLSGIRTDTSVFRPASYLSSALDNLGLVLLVGAALLLLVLLALRFHWRAVIIAAITIPLSLVSAVLVLHMLGQGLNVMILAGLAAAIAVVVDEAVAPTDRVLGRIREQQPGEPVNRLSIVRDASLEIRRPLTYAALIVLLAIAPVAVMGGRPGAFFDPMVLAYGVAVVAATVVAVAVAPVLSVYLFSRWEPSGADRGWLGRATKRYASMLQGFARGPLGPAIAVGACVLLAVVSIPLLGVSLIPTFQDRDVLVRLDAAPGTSNPRMVDITTELSSELRDIPGVASVGAHVGRAVTGDRIANVSSSDIWVNIDPDADYDATLAAIEAATADNPDARGEVVTASAEDLRDVGALTRGENLVRSNDLDLLTGVDKPLVVRVYGQNQQELARQAERVRDLVARVDGVVAPEVRSPAVEPTVEIEVDLDRAQSSGITPGAVRRAEATLLQGIQVGMIFQEQKVFDVIVQGVPSTRESVESVSNLLIDRPGGGHVKLGEVADVRITDIPSVIQRDAVSRRLDVVADVDGRSVSDITADIENRLADVQFPLEYHAEVLDEGTNDEIGTGRVIGFAIVAVIAAYLLLQAAFRSWRLAALLTVTVPLGLVGGLLVALADGAELSLGSLLGLLAVFGFALRAGTVLVSDMQSRKPADGESRADLVGSTAAERFGPVVTSAAAMAALVLPFAVIGSRPGLELLHPMALVMLGALATTVLVTLFVVPGLYVHLASDTEQGVTEDWEQMESTVLLEPSSAGAPWPRQRAGSAAVPDEETVK